MDMFLLYYEKFRLIEDYDRRMMTDKMEELNPVELLRSLLENAKWSQSKFAEQIGVSRQLINDILAYRRNISKELVVKFANFFAMSQEAFSRNYDLQSSLTRPYVLSTQISIANEPSVTIEDTSAEKSADDSSKLE